MFNETFSSIRQLRQSRPEFRSYRHKLWFYDGRQVGICGLNRSGNALRVRFCDVEPDAEHAYIDVAFDALECRGRG